MATDLLTCPPQSFGNVEHIQGPLGGSEEEESRETDIRSVGRDVHTLQQWCDCLVYPAGLKYDSTTLKAFRHIIYLTYIIVWIAILKQNNQV